MASGSPTAGEEFTLECSVGGYKGIFQWLGPPDGNTPFVESTSRSIMSNLTTSQLQFRPIQQSHGGSYSCDVSTGGQSFMSQLIFVSVNGMHRRIMLIVVYVIIFLYNAAPSILIQISNGEVTPTVGENYQLICSVSRAENLNPTITYLWTKNSDIQLGTNSNTLSFTPLRLSDAANYACMTTVSSIYLEGSIAATNSKNVSIQSKFRDY